MSSRLKTVIICLCAAAVVIAGALFGIYKYFVTPQRMVLLSLMDVKEELEESFSYLDEGSVEDIKDFFSEGGKLDSELVITDSIFNDGMKVNFTANKDENCTVSELTFNDKFDFKTYKDSSQIYINTPLFGGGFKIPVRTFAQEWNSSIFKDIVSLPDSYGAAGVLKDFAIGNYDAESFVKGSGSEIMTLAGMIEIEKTGSATVMEGSKKKKASEYTAHITKQQAESFIDILLGYIKKSGYGSQKLEEIAETSALTKEEAAVMLENELKSFAYDMDIVLKIDGTELREAVIKADGADYTAAFEGEKNCFDMMSFYVNGDTQNAWRRVKSGKSGNTTDKISKGGTTYFTFEANSDGFDMRLNYDGIEAYVSAHSMKELGAVTEFEGFEIGVDGLLTLKGTLDIYDDYDEDFSFSKSGDYVDILSISSEEWQAVSGTFISGLKLLSGTE